MKDFLRLAKHQLKGPLTLIRGYLSFLQNGSFQKFPAEKQKEIIGKMALASKKLDLLINDVFLPLQIEEGLVIKSEPIPIKALIEDIYNTSLKQNYEQKNLFLKIQDSSGAALIINSDKFYLAIALQKLLDNAEKYSAPGQTIDIHIDKKENYAIIEIKDSGIGISPEEMPKIFNTFFRSPKAKEVWSEGAGLGLSIVKSIIETLKGKIGVESEGLNKGTKFIVKLPI